MTTRAPSPRVSAIPAPPDVGSPLATGPTGALIDHAIARRPAWAIRMLVRRGRGPMRHTAVAELVGSLPAGYASTAEEAVAAYRARNPLAPAQGDYRAFPLGRV